MTNELQINGIKKNYQTLVFMQSFIMSLKTKRKKQTKKSLQNKTKIILKLAYLLVSCDNGKLQNVQKLSLHLR